MQRSLTCMLILPILLILQFQLNQLTASLSSCTKSSNAAINIPRLVVLDLLRSTTICTRTFCISLQIKQPFRHRKGKSWTRLCLLLVLLLLLLSGDIELNPGPPRDPCGYCSKSVTGYQFQLRCSTCRLLFHRTCSGLPLKDFKTLILTATPWKCAQCLNSTIYPCGVCNYHVRDDQLSILCSFCNLWIHHLCTGLSEPELMSYDGADIYYACPKCAMPFSQANISLGTSYLIDSDSDSVYSPNNSVFNQYAR